MYTSQSNQRHGVEQDQIQTREPYEKNDQKYSNEKRRYKKKNMTKKDPATNKHSVAGIRKLSPLCDLVLFLFDKMILAKAFPLF